MSIRRFYGRWPQYDRRITKAVAGLTDEQLAIRHGPEAWPLWATVGHTASGRTYWLVSICGEPAPADLPFALDVDWADDPDHPRGADELVRAMTSSFSVVDALLDRWTPEMLDEVIRRPFGGTVQEHTRSSILQRLITHEAWHAAQISDALASNGLGDIDLWRSSEP